MGFIGAYSNGIGFGNISQRLKQNQFIISGSGTGKFEKLTNRHYTKVTGFDIGNNSIIADGPIIPSSESLTHAVIYRYTKDINAIIHIHSIGLWKKLLDIVPTTKKNVEYGTPRMAKEIERLFKETNLFKGKILVMAGHEEGIISFGKNLAEAGKIICDYSAPKRSTVR